MALQPQPDDISGVPIPDPASAQLPPPTSPQEEFLRNAYAEALEAEKEYAKEHGAGSPATTPPALGQAEAPAAPAAQTAEQASELTIPREPAAQPQAVPPPSTVVQPAVPPTPVPPEFQSEAPDPEDQSNSFKIPR